MNNTDKGTHDAEFANLESGADGNNLEDPKQPKGNFFVRLWRQELSTGEALLFAVACGLVGYSILSALHSSLPRDDYRLVVTIGSMFFLVLGVLPSLHKGIAQKGVLSWDGLAIVMAVSIFFLHAYFTWTIYR